MAFGINIYECQSCPWMTICVVNQLKKDSYCYGLYNFIINSSFQRLRDSCQLAILNNATNRIGTSEKISLNIKSHRNTAITGASMPLKMDINQISQWVHLKLNQKSKYEKNNPNISSEGSKKLQLFMFSTNLMLVSKREIQKHQ